MVVQPAPFSRGQTAIEPSSEIEVSENYGPAFLRNPNASLSELVDSINRMGVSPGDLVAILESLSQAGAPTAALVILCRRLSLMSARRRWRTSHPPRSAEGRVGKRCVRTGTSGWAPK